MSSSVRPTDNVVAIFNTMLERPGKAWYGLEIAKEAGIGSATIYAALTRLERANLVTAAWEDVDPAQVGRPRRRLYRLTGEGKDIGLTLVRGYRPRVKPSKSWPGVFPHPEGRLR